jgi:hypothetical protein
MILHRLWRITICAAVLACLLAMAQDSWALSLCRSGFATVNSKATKQNATTAERSLSTGLTLSRVHNHPPIAKHGTHPASPIRPKPYTFVDANYDDSLEAISSHHDPMASLIDAEIQTAVLEAISCDLHKWGQRPLTVGTTLFSAHSLLRI